MPKKKNKINICTCGHLLEYHKSNIKIKGKSSVCMFKVTNIAKDGYIFKSWDRCIEFVPDNLKYLEDLNNEK